MTRAEQLRRESFGTVVGTIAGRASRRSPNAHHLTDEEKHRGRSSRSAVKIAAARRNGLKGGRPNTPLKAEDTRP